MRIKDFLICYDKIWLFGKYLAFGQEEMESVGGR